MSNNTPDLKLVSNLEECVADFSIIDSQVAALYDVIKAVKHDKDKEELLYVYKQLFDALRAYSGTFNDLIRVVKKQIEETHERPRREQ